MVRNKLKLIMKWSENNDKLETERIKSESGEEKIKSNVLSLIWVGKLTNCLRL